MLLSGHVPQQKALQFWNKLGEGDPDFSASVGWTAEKNVMESVSLGREELSSNTDDKLKFRQKFYTLIQNESITGNQIFNCDGSALNLKILPYQTLA